MTETEIVWHEETRACSPEFRRASLLTAHDVMEPNHG
jgi:hypothetical protein